jgi:CO/xanthine dehydrogenase FAD-binding subunit
MKPAPFEYFAPDSHDEALHLLARYGEDARILAGGQSLVPLMNMRMVQPRIVISINRCSDLDYIRSDGGYLAFGAMVRQHQIEKSATARTLCPLLTEAMPLVGGAANRNRGTLCGNLAHADPLAEPPAVAVALNAEMVIASNAGRRTLPAARFFVSDLTNAMVPGELLEEVRFPARPSMRAAFVEVANRAHGFAIVGVAATFLVDSAQRCHAVAISGIGVGPTPMRLAAAERTLEGEAITDALVRSLEEAARDGLAPTSTFHADAAYRRHLVGVLAGRAVKRAGGIGRGRA